MVDLSTSSMFGQTGAPRKGSPSRPVNFMLNIFYTFFNSVLLVTYETVTVRFVKWMV